MRLANSSGAELLGVSSEPVVGVRGSWLVSGGAGCGPRVSGRGGCVAGWSPERCFLPQPPWARPGARCLPGTAGLGAARYGAAAPGARPVPPPLSPVLRLRAGGSGGGRGRAGGAASATSALPAPGAGRSP